MQKNVRRIEEGKDDSIIDIDNDVSVDVKLFQSIYNKITGKSESIIKYFKDSTVINADDIRQLDLKIRQILGQFRRLCG